MRIRTQLITLTTLAVALLVIAMGTLVWTVSEVDRLARQQRGSQTVSRELLSLLALTQEFALFGEERAVLQWQLSLKTTLAALDTAEVAGSTDVASMRKELALLPDMFAALHASVLAPTAQDGVERKKRELLIDGLITGTQSVADDAFRWEDQVSAARVASERRLMVAAIALPGLLALLTAVGVAVQIRRVLRPLDALRGVMQRVADGDLSARSNNRRPDEVGDLARSFDDMTARLDIGARTLRRNELWLRALVENLPARIAYLDLKLRFRFANTSFAASLDRRPDEIVGATLESLRDPADWQAVRPRIEAVMRGQAQHYERVEATLQGERTVAASMVPDIDEQGRVVGVYVLGFDITERKKQEEALYASEQRAKLLVENIPDYAIYLLDPDGRVATWNLGAQRNKGFEADAIIGRHFRRFFTPEDVAAGVPEAELAQAASVGRYETEGWRVRADGSRFWAGIVLAAIRDAKGEITGFSMVTRDLTDKRRQQDLLSRIAEAAPTAMFTTNAKGIVTLVNAQVEKMFGYSRAELLGRSVERLSPKRFVPQYRAAFAKLTSTREQVKTTDQIGLRADGKEIPIEVSYSPIDTADGLAALISVTDLTERKAQQDLLSRITEAAPAAMLVVNAEGRISLVNAQAESLFGKPRAELLNQPIEVLLPERFRQGHPAKRGGFMGQASVRTMGAGSHLYALRADGSEFPVDISLAPIDTAEGPAALAAVFDLSERFAQQANTEKSLREKDVLLREIHHRVKNNMQVISSLLQLQLGSIDDPVTQQIFKESQNRIEAMALVHEKLYQRLDLANIDMAEYVEGLVAMLLSAYGERCAHVNVVVQTQPALLDVDQAIPAGLVLNELISNAFKHAFPNQRRGELRVEIGPQDDGRVRLAVTDDGIGMPAGFDVENSTSLGLRLVNILSSQLGADLHFGAGPGDGGGGFACTLVFGSKKNSHRGT